MTVPHSTLPESVAARFSIIAETLAERRSCRAFLPGEVPRPVIEAVLRAAQHAPSWSNVQPWHVSIVSGAALAELIAGFADPDIDRGPDLEFPQRYDGVYRDRRRATGWQLYDALGIERGDRAASAAEAARNFEFFGAPHGAVVTTERSLGAYGVLDCGFFVQAFLTAAEAAGLGAIAQASIASRASFLHTRLSIPKSRVVVCGIAFGYSDLTHPSAGLRTQRAELDDVATFL